MNSCQVKYHFNITCNEFILKSMTQKQCILTILFTLILIPENDSKTSVFGVMGSLT